MFLFIVCLTYSGIPCLGKVCLGMFPFIVCLTYYYIPQGIMPRYGTSSRRFMSSFSLMDIYLEYDIPKYTVPSTLHLFPKTKCSVSICTIICVRDPNFSFCKIPWLPGFKKVLPPIYYEIFYYVLYLILIYIKLE